MLTPTMAAFFVALAKRSLTIKKVNKMENNNSEKTGRLTPGQIDKIVSLSSQISEAREIHRILKPLYETSLQAIVIKRGARSFAVQRLGDHTELHNTDGSTIPTHNDSKLFDLLADYFAEKRSRLESELAAVISGEGGER